MSVGTVYGPTKNGRANKVHVTAKLCNLELTHATMNANFEFGKTNKSPEYLAKFPLGQVPAFEAKDGLLLTESNAIAIYLAELQSGAPLLGSTANDKAKIMQYIFFAETQLAPHAATIIYPAFGYLHYDERAEKMAYERLDIGLNFLEKELNNKKFLVGDKLSLADIITCENLSFAFSKIFDEAYRNRFPTVTKYYKSYREIKEVKEVDGEVELADKPWVIENKN